MRGIDKMEEGALGIDAGDDGLDGDFFAIGENDAVTAPSLMRMCWLRIGADFSAGLFRRFGGACREGAEPAAGNAASPRDEHRRGAQKKDGRRSGGQGPARAPKMPRAAMTERRSSVSKIGDEIRNGHGTPSGADRRCRLAKPANAATGLEETPEIFGVGLSIAGGVMEVSFVKKRRFFERQSKLGVLGGSLAERRAISAAVLATFVVEKERLAVRGRSKARGSG